jgi:MFS family permease
LASALHDSGLIGTHFIPHAVEHGFTEGQAAGILSVIGGMNVVGTLASGWLCDRYPPRLLLAGYYFFRALSLLVLPSSRPCRSCRSSRSSTASTTSPRCHRP